MGINVGGLNSRAIALVSDEFDMTATGPFTWGGNWSASLGGGGNRFYAHKCLPYVTASSGTCSVAPANIYIGNEPTSSYANIIAAFTPVTAAVYNLIGSIPYAVPVGLSVAGTAGNSAFGSLANLAAPPRVTVTTPGSGTNLVLKMKFVIWGALLVP